MKKETKRKISKLEFKEGKGSLDWESRLNARHYDLIIIGKKLVWPNL